MRRPSGAAFLRIAANFRRTCNLGESACKRLRSRGSAACLGTSVAAGGADMGGGQQLVLGLCLIGLGAAAALAGEEASPPSAASGASASPASSATTASLALTPRARPNRPLTSRAPARLLAEESQPSGFKLGTVEVRPFAEVTYLWDDNVLALPGAVERPDFLMTYLPGLELGWQPNPALSADARYAFGWTDYLDNEARDYLTHEAECRLIWQHFGVRGLTLSLSESYRQTGNTDALDNEFQAFRRLHGNILAPAVSYQTGKLGMRVSYRHELVDYFSRSDRIQDYISHGAEGLFYFRLTERSMLAYARYEGEWSRFGILDSRDFDAHLSASGVRGRHERLSYEIEFGYRQGNGHVLRKDDGGWLLAASLEYEAARFVSLQVSARREYLSQIQSGNSTQGEVSCSATFRMRTSFELNVLLDWLQEDREGGFRQRTLTAQLESVYRLGKRLKWMARYERLERTDNRSQDVTINRAGIGLRVQF